MHRLYQHEHILEQNLPLSIQRFIQKRNSLRSSWLLSSRKTSTPDFLVFLNAVEVSADVSKEIGEISFPITVRLRILAINQSEALRYIINGIFSPKFPVSIISVSEKLIRSMTSLVLVSSGLGGIRIFC